MASPTLDRVLEEVKALTPDEQQQLRDALNELLANPQIIEYLLQKSLYESGLLSEIKSSRTGQINRPFKPIEVEGKPVSETIIEERR
jgi:spore germination protein GerM